MSQRLAVDTYAPALEFLPPPLEHPALRQQCPIEENCLLARLQPIPDHHNRSQLPPQNDGLSDNQEPLGLKAAAYPSRNRGSLQTQYHQCSRPRPQLNCIRQMYSAKHNAQTGSLCHIK